MTKTTSVIIAITSLALVALVANAAERAAISALGSVAIFQRADTRNSSNLNADPQGAGSGREPKPQFSWCVGEDALYQACERQSDRWSNLTHRWVYPLGKHHFEQAANGSTRILTLATRDGF